jgi:hypothetical protein
MFNLCFFKKGIKATLYILIIMKHNCDYCDYHTDSRAGYCNHCRTAKHINNKIDSDNQLNKMIQKLERINCNICDGLFLQEKFQAHVEKCLLSSLQEKQLLEVSEANKNLINRLDDANNKLNDANKNHNLEIKELNNNYYLKMDEISKNYNIEMKELMKKLEEANDKIQKIFIEYNVENKEDKKYFKDLVQKAGTVVTSVMDYLNKNCPDTPITKKLEHYELEETEDKTCDNLVFNEKNHSLDNYLVEYMKKKYIENDIMKQTFWSTDVSRFSYIFRGVRNPYDADNKSENIWLYDKQGIKIGEIVIRPFLNYIGDIINKKLRNILPMDIRREPMYADYLSKIYKKIELLTLERDMVEYMASHFQFDKTLLSNNKKIEHEEKKAGNNEDPVEPITKINKKKIIKAKIAKK